MTRNWLKWWPLARSKSPAVRNSLLRLESLEDRTTPATFTVSTTLDNLIPGDGKRSLREAISAANAAPGADLIVVPVGAYKIQLALLLGGDFDVSDTLTIQGAGAGLTIVDGQQLDRVFDVIGTAPSSIKAVFQGLTIRNGNATGDGGGIRVGNADLVVRDCAVAGNQASMTGGGISNGASPGTGVTLVSTTVARNAAGASGGGVAVSGAGSELTLRDSTIRRNVAVIGGGILTTITTLTNSRVTGNTASSVGGGIGAFTATLTNCNISGNSAGSGGGGIRADSSANLTSCTVSGNTTDGSGGGVSATTANLIRSTISGNMATTGGGISATAANLTNSTVSGNTADVQGGGIHATAANLLNVTVVENIAQAGGGVFHVPGEAFVVKNSLIALNRVGFGGNGPDLVGSAFSTQGHNLIGDGTGGIGFTNGVSGDIVGTAVNPIDPKIGPLTGNGGRTKTHALLAGSRAMDAGDNSILPPTDQRGLGFARKKDGNGDGVARVDIGAFEN